MSGLSLLAPIGLIALLAAPFIIVLHMRHTTPIEQRVPALRFWRSAAPVTTVEARFQIPPLTLVLILQVLAAVALALALARPAVSLGIGDLMSRAEPQHLIVLLDGSSSMAAMDAPEGVSRYEAARDLAIGRLGGLGDGDTATVVLMGTRMETFQASDLPAIQALSRELAGIALPGGMAEVDAALQLVADLDLPDVRERIVLVTDGAIAVDPSIAEQIRVPIELHQVGEPRSGNLALTEIVSRPSVNRPGEQDLYLQVSNFGDDRQRSTALIVADGEEFYRENVDLPPRSASDIVVLGIPEGTRTVIAEVRSSDPLFADNQATLLLQARSGFGTRVLYVGDTLSHLYRALGVIPGVSIESISSMESLQGNLPPGPFDLVVYESATPKPEDFPDTPMLAVAPPRDSVTPAIGVMTAPELARVRAHDALLRGVDLTGLVVREAPVHELDSTAVEIAGAESGPLIYRTQRWGPEQPAVVITFDLEESNLPARVAFPILIANAVYELVPAPVPATVALGSSIAYTPQSGATTIRIIDPLGSTIDTPVRSAKDDGAFEGASREARSVTFTSTGSSGIYSVQELSGDGRVLDGAQFVVNAGHAEESDLHANADLDASLALAGSGTEEASRSLHREIWPLLLIVAAVALLLEAGWALGSRRRPAIPNATPMVGRGAK
jgi:Ca-activated chloride channel homolog